MASKKKPNRTIIIAAVVASLVVCVGAIVVAGLLAGSIGAVYMTFGVILMVVLSAIAVWFRIYYEGKNPGGRPSPRR